MKSTGMIKTNDLFQKVNSGKPPISPQNLVSHNNIILMPLEEDGKLWLGSKNGWQDLGAES